MLLTLEPSPCLGTPLMSTSAALLGFGSGPIASSHAQALQQAARLIPCARQCRHLPSSMQQRYQMLCSHMRCSSRHPIAAYISATAWVWQWPDGLLTQAFRQLPHLLLLPGVVGQRAGGDDTQHVVVEGMALQRMHIAIAHFILCSCGCQLCAKYMTMFGLCTCMLR